MKPLKKTNMKKKTAIESLIKKLKEQIRQSAHNELGTNRTGEYRIGLTKAIEFCEEHLEMEKHQIIDSYKQGQFDSIPIRETDGEQYFNLIFNQPLNKSK
jgi:hypothetical protein